jgi:hypothetical protein
MIEPENVDAVLEGPAAKRAKITDFASSLFVGARAVLWRSLLTEPIYDTGVESTISAIDDCGRHWVHRSSSDKTKSYLCMRTSTFGESKIKALVVVPVYDDYSVEKIVLFPDDNMDAKTTSWIRLPHRLTTGAKVYTIYDWSFGGEDSKFGSFDAISVLWDEWNTQNSPTLDFVIRFGVSTRSASAAASLDDTESKSFKFHSSQLAACSDVIKTQLRNSLGGDPKSVYSLTVNDQDMTELGMRAFAAMLYGRHGAVDEKASAKDFIAADRLRRFLSIDIPGTVLENGVISTLTSDTLTDAVAYYSEFGPARMKARLCEWVSHKPGMAVEALRMLSSRSAHSASASFHSNKRKHE